MEAAQGIAQLLDFRFGQILLVLGFRELVRDVVQVTEHTLEHFPDLLQFGFGLFQE